jgi:hypothetical protein
MRISLLFSLAALLLFPALASAQFVVFNDEGSFLSAVEQETIIEFEEVADDDAITISDQNGAFTRESVHFEATDISGNPAFAQVIGRDFSESIGLDPYNLGSGDFVETVSERPVVVGMNFEDVDPEGIGFRVDNRIGFQQLSVLVRTTNNNVIEDHQFSLDASGPGHIFFGFASTNDAKVLDVTLTGDVGSPTPQIAFDRVTYAPISAVPGPSALPLFGAGLAALGLQLRRRRA